MITDDHMMVRKGLATVLSTMSDFDVVGEAQDGEQAVLMFDHLLPDVVLMDLKMPRMDGVTAIRTIREHYPDAKIVALTSFDDDELVQQALQAGAMGYLLKNVTTDDLAKAIRAAYAGKRILAPEAADALLRSLRKDPPPGNDLTDREREVLKLMVDGLNNTEIAGRLFLSPSTIKFHVSSILSKLGVTNRVEAVALAVKHRDEIFH
jgi:NarL family two-component system response regulator LiaR